MVTKKTGLTAILVVLIVVAGIAITTTLFSDNGKQNKPSNSTDTTSTQLETITVDDLLKQHAAYLNKEVSVQGTVIKHSAGYSIVGTKDSKVGTRLSIPQTIDMKKYFDKDTSVSKKPLKVIGTYKDDNGKGLAIFVRSVSE